jgi:predicted secreted Zn-dependent protease
MFLISSVVTAIALLSLLALKRVEAVLKKDTYAVVSVLSLDTAGQYERVEEIVANCGAHTMEMGIEKELECGTVLYSFRVRMSPKNSSCRLVDALSGLDGVRRVSVQ